MDIPKTKLRYFALGLVLCHIVAIQVYSQHIPEITKNPDMWLNVQLAVSDGMYICLLLGTFAGFTFAYKSLPALQVFLLSIFTGAGIISVIVSGIMHSLSLEVTAFACLLVGFVTSWGSATLFGRCSGIVNLAT